MTWSLSAETACVSDTSSLFLLLSSLLTGTHCGKIQIFVQKIKFSIITFLAGKFKFNVGVDFIKIEFLNKNWDFASVCGRVEKMKKEGIFHFSFLNCAHPRFGQVSLHARIIGILHFKGKNPERLDGLQTQNCLKSLKDHNWNNYFRVVKAIFVLIWAILGMIQHFRQCFLKEIGVLKDLTLRKSEKIVKIEIVIHKRHLAIFLNFGDFRLFLIILWYKKTPIIT